MAITRNGTVTEISGTLTLNEVLASAEFTVSEGMYVRLDRDVRVMDGADLSLMNGIIWDLNGRNFDPQTVGNCPLIIGCTFHYNGVVAQGGESNQWGLESVNLKDCNVYFRNTRAVAGIAGADNVVFSGAFDSSLGQGGNTTDSAGGGAPFFNRGNTYNNVTFYNPFRVGVAGLGNVNDINARYHLKNMFIQAAGAFLIGYNNSPESIWENCTLTGQTSFTVDTFLNNARENNMILLGNNSIDMFFDGGTTFTRNNASNNFRLYTGGKRYFNILNGNNMRFQFMATINGTEAARPIVVTRDVDHLLSDTFITIASDDENVDMTLLTGIWDPGGTAALGGNGLVNYTNLRLIGRTYEKVPYFDNPTLNDAQEIEGSSDLYTPLLIADDALVTNTEADASNLTGIAITKATGTPSPTNPHRIVVSNAARTLDEVYDYWKWWFCQTTQFDINDKLTATGNKLTLGNYRLEFT